MKRIDRRAFFKCLGASVVAMAGLQASARSRIDGLNRAIGTRRKVISILHTNDVHSRIDPLPDDHPLYPGLGGYARRQAYINTVRSQSDATLVFECGDMFQGTPYFNLYKGRLEISLMNRMGVDAVTFGNHEFDNGVEMLARRVAEARFPFLNANYEFANADLRRMVRPAHVFERCGIRIGVMGLGVVLDGLVTEPQLGGTRVLDTFAVVNETARRLRHDEGCRLVIVLSHMGLTMPNGIDDRTLAARSRNIDMILGGHTHTFMPEPEYVTDLDGRSVMINQVGYAGINVGRVDIEVDDDDRLALVPHPAALMA